VIDVINANLLSVQVLAQSPDGRRLYSTGFTGTAGPKKAIPPSRVQTQRGP